VLGALAELKGADLSVTYCVLSTSARGPSKLLYEVRELRKWELRGSQGLWGRGRDSVLVAAWAWKRDVSSPSLRLPVCILQGWLPLTSPVGRAQMPPVRYLAHARLIIPTMAVTLSNKVMKISHRAMLIQTAQPGIIP